MSDMDKSSSAVFGPRLMDCFIFDDELYFAQDNAHETVEGYLIAHDVLVQRMLNEIRSRHISAELGTIDNINFYPTYNLSYHSIKLEGTYWYANASGEHQASFSLPLSTEEQATLISTMEDYCVFQNGCDCTAMLNVIRAADELQPLPSKQDSLARKVGRAERNRSAASSSYKNLLERDDADR